MAEYDAVFEPVAKELRALAECPEQGRLGTSTGTSLDITRRWNVYKFKIDRAFRFIGQLSFANALALLRSAQHDTRELAQLMADARPCAPSSSPSPSSTSSSSESSESSSSSSSSIGGGFYAWALSRLAWALCVGGAAWSVLGIKEVEEVLRSVVGGGAAAGHSSRRYRWSSKMHGD